MKILKPPIKERTINKTSNIDSIIEGLKWQIPLPKRMYEHLGWKQSLYNNDYSSYTRNNRYLITYVQESVMFPTETCYLTTFEGNLQEIK